MTEWIDPRYAELVAAMRRAQCPPQDPDRSGPRPARGFVVPKPPA
ncbi:hypothetical protein ABZ135_21975 [Streptomyces sp. NPDC006339]